jgi:hypothetical protein
MTNIIKFDEVQNKIITLRGQRVILDSDVAKLYEIETMRVNEAVKNNPDKFPDDYIIILSSDEKKEVIENFDNLKIKFSPTMPKAFTEKGLYMLATILKSERATQTTIAIVEAFAHLKEFSRAIAELSTTTDKEKKQQLVKQSSNIFADLLGDNGMEVTDDEVSMEMNLAMFKVKRTVRRKKKSQ